jgi:hypothetical protein
MDDLEQAGENFRRAVRNMAKAKGLSEEDTDRMMKRSAMRLGGATHEEALAAFPRIEPRRDRDGVIR